MSDTLRNALNSLTVCDVTNSENDNTTSNGDVNNDDDEFAWVRGGQDNNYKEGGLPLVSMVDENGHTLKLRDARGLLMSPNISIDVLHRVTSVTARHDDVLIATYPKCGTHWIWEIVSMLRADSDSLMASPMQNVDYLPLDMIQALPSPRVLSTHMPFSRVPRGFLEQGCKVVWCVRNPWDVAVSYFNFIRKLSVFGYPGTWSGFFELFLDGKVPYNSWFEHTAEWLKAMESRASILLVRYEDLHNNFKREVRRIADHLDIPLSEQRLNKMKAETSFANMSAKKVDMTMALSTDGTSPVYRKGKSGDWINWFTERQSAELHGAYRVAIGPHNRRLQYSRGKAANGMPA